MPRRWPWPPPRASVQVGCCVGPSSASCVHVVVPSPYEQAVTPWPMSKRATALGQSSHYRARHGAVMAPLDREDSPLSVRVVCSAVGLVGCYSVVALLLASAWASEQAPAAR